MGRNRKWCVVRKKLICNSDCIFYEDRASCKKILEFLDSSLDNNKFVKKYMKVLRTPDNIIEKGEEDGKRECTDAEGYI